MSANKVVIIKIITRVSFFLGNIEANEYVQLFKPSLSYPAGALRAPAGPKGQKAPKGPFGPLGQSACFGAGCYIEMATSCH